ncbi:MinD/ParA family ATP-binding protein [Thiobacter aerophilum]|uniref:Flagellar biosynthesis protein FlhG n=1 Tax=Thiobacter aerophilum TaxID=3121275 RepID=A0ABV0EIQ5_9BURK
MGAFVSDQAEGLRRLLRPDALRVVALAAALEGVGRTTVLYGLAAALAQRGRRILVMSERRHRIPADLAPTPRHDLATVLRGARPLDQAVAHGEQGVAWLELGDALARLPSLDLAGQETLSAAFARMAQDVDVLLLDPLAGGRPASLALQLAAQEQVLVLCGAAEAITQSYALIKRLARGFAQRHFHVVMAKVRAGSQAKAIYNNLAQTAGRHLGVRLEWLGELPMDAQARQADRLGRSVVDAFPDSRAAAASRQLAQAIESWPWPDDGTEKPDAFVHKLVMTSRLAAENAHL